MKNIIVGIGFGIIIGYIAGIFVGVFKTTQLLSGKCPAHVICARIVSNKINPLFKTK